MCKQITIYATAEAKWVKFTEQRHHLRHSPWWRSNQTMPGRTEQTRKNICTPGVAAEPAGPSLSDALGTARLPMPETTKSGSGTLDTLTGNAIQK
jgi:hypothetical protein